MKRRRTFRGPLCGPFFFLLCALLLCGSGARAADRPLLATTSAAAEEDDDAVWSVEAAFMRRRGLRTLSLAPEYAFDPTTSVQVELAHAREREAGASARGVELEFKHLFNHIARDGWGIGVAAALGWSRAEGEGWRRSESALALPLSWALPGGRGLLHLNAGVEKSPGERRSWTRSIALEGEVARRTTLFGEFAREGGERLLHAGVRWWLQREKLALDLAWHRLRGDEGRAGGVVLGLGFYDL